MESVLNILKILYGIVFVLFLPGFIISFIFFEKKKIEVIERVALSFALSVAVVPLIVFYANLLGIKISAFSVSLVIFQIITVALLILLAKMYLKKKNEKQG